MPGSDPDATSIFAGGPAPTPEEEERKRWPMILFGALVVALLIAAVVFGPTLFRPAPEENPSQR